jgi:uncharacterized membrane-anchored protein
MFAHLLELWTSFYSNHALLRTTVGFAHVGGLMLGGGCAITADLATIEAVREGPIGRSSQLHVLKRTHTIVVIGLAALVVSGLLLFAADADAFLHSWIFWVKMGLMGTLLINGVAMLIGERRVVRGDTRAWARLHTVAVSSLLLWFLTTLAGAALPNI